MSRDLNDLLASDESVVYQTRQHWFVVVRNIAVRLLVLAVVAVLLGYVTSADWLDNTAGEWIGYAVWAVIALSHICPIQIVLGWKATIAAVISILPVLGYLWGRKRQAEIDQARRDREALRDARYRREVDQDVSEMGAQDVSEELSRWNRD